MKLAQLLFLLTMMLTATDKMSSSEKLENQTGKRNSIITVGWYKVYLLMHFRSMARVKWRYFPISLNLLTLAK